MSNRCAIIGACNWWWCKEHNDCLHDSFDRRNNPVITILSKPKKTRIAKPPHKNAKVFKPDVIYGTAKFIYCHYCGTLVPAEKITKDHIIPKSQGGGYKNNIVPACGCCNLEKGDKPYLIYLQERINAGKTLSMVARENLEKEILPTVFNNNYSYLKDGQ